ncbi:hypothetical protein GCM10010472_40340 [Pseudonocardia halophobica]|uniref:Uncharacterized protein n=1 Tax=Pseudonocardia halophobica TaxID=29401 RepID=A0A9W6UFF4_9PSEU|nr:hypothetical protein [Pseudonocardia halophobica]GLL15442.1 hypothetical protein GCM10017577_65930 [Pseudonocardia halophobica]
MTGFRPPSVAGVSGGVGTTTLALALHGQDGGTGAGIEADIVVCRSSAESLDRAARIADLFDPTAVPPVLAVTVDGAERRHPERLDELGPGWAAVVLVPHVGRWRGIVDPYREAAGLLGTPRDRLPRALRPYLDAVTRLARAVADSGRLGRPAPTPRPPTTPPAAAPRREPTPTAPPITTPPTATILRNEPMPVTTSPPPEPRHTPEAGFTSYRAFVPVGADGPLTSVAVPRPQREPVAALNAAPTDVSSTTTPARASGFDPTPHVPMSESSAPANVLDPAPHHPTTPSPTTPPAPPAPITTTHPTPGPTLTHPDLRPVRGIRILDVGDPLDVGGRA